MRRAICRLCAQVNPEGARFCNECGSPLTLVACPECEAINGLDAAHCHQCGASLGSHEQEVDASISASEATSVPTPPQSGPLLQDTSGDKTPIALAERFERGHASSRRTLPPRRGVDDRAAVSVPAEPAHHEIEPSFDEHAMVEEPVDLRGSEPPQPLRTAPQRRVPAAILAIVVIGIAAGSYYGWLETTRHPDVAAPANSSTPNAQTEGAASTASTENATPAASGENTAPNATPAAPPAATTNETVPPTRSTSQRPAAVSSEAATSPPATSPEPAASLPSAPPSMPAPARAHSAPRSPANTRAAATSSGPTISPSNERQATHARPATRAPKVDKDAAATERLIERDLGKFLPRTETNGSAQ